MYHIRSRRYFAAENPEWPFSLTAEERQLGLAGLSKKYLEEASQQAIAANWSTDIARALSTWDRQTPGEWLRSRGASAGAAELLTFGFGTDFGSAASFLLHGLNSRSTTGSFRVEGGNERLPQEFAKRVTVRYGVAVSGVSQSDTEVRVTIRTAGDPETLAADRAVCALPCPVIGGIFQDARLSSAKQRAIREQNYSRTVKVFLQSRTRFWLKQGLSGFLTTDLPMERMTPDPGIEVEERGALAAYPIAAYTATLEKLGESERVAAAFGQARQIFPEFDKAFEGGISKSWGLDPWQRGSFALHTPGQIGFIPTLAAREGRIHFAGEHTSPWTGWMQGALESARRVVQEING
jgi:monoamine oxidase